MNKEHYQLIADIIYSLDESAIYNITSIPTNDSDSLTIHLGIDSPIEIDSNFLSERLGIQVELKVTNFEFSQALVYCEVEDSKSPFKPTTNPGTALYVLQAFAYLLCIHRSSYTRKPTGIGIDYREGELKFTVRDDSINSEANQPFEPNLELSKAISEIFPSDIKTLIQTLSLNKPIYQTQTNYDEPTLSNVVIDIAKNTKYTREVLLNPFYVEIPTVYGLMASF